MLNDLFTILLSNFSKVLLIILGSVFGLFLIYLIFILTRMSHFSQRLKNKNRSLAICVAEERRMILEIDKLIKKSYIKVDSTYEELLERILRLNNSKIIYKNIKNDFELFGSFRKYISKNKYLFKIENEAEYINLTNLIKALDEEKRKQIVLFNTDTDAYNFWMNSFFTKWLFNLLKIKNKSKI